MGSLEEILERVQYKFASIIGELCGEPLALSQFAIWVDLRLAEYKLRGSISLDCSRQKIDPEWLSSLQTIHYESPRCMRNNSNTRSKPPVPSPSNHSNHIYPDSFALNSSAPHSSFISRSTIPQCQPPFAHTTASQLRHSAEQTVTNTTIQQNAPVKFTPNGFTNELNAIKIKTEVSEQDGFLLSRPPENSVSSTHKKRSSSTDFIEISEVNFPPSKQPRIYDNLPPLKPLCVDSMLPDFNQRSERNKAAHELRSEHDDSPKECDYVASTSSDSTDIPEDLSMSRCNSSNFKNHIISNSDFTTVARPIGEYSCLSNGPRFLREWQQFVTNRSINLKSMSVERYRGYMSLLKVAQSKVHVPKSVKEHKMLYKFDLWRDGSTERLIKKRHKDTDPVRFYISDEQLYHALLAVHLDSGHGGIKKMLNLCKERYANITADAVKLFTHLCFDCQARKRTIPPKLKEPPDLNASKNDDPVVNSSTSPPNPDLPSPS